MSADGVIPLPEDRKGPYTWLAGEISHMEGPNIRVVVDYDTVLIGAYRFSQAQLEGLAQAIVSAAWDAARNAERMSREAVP